MWREINTPKARTVGAIALYPSGNEQGWWFFMSLATGHRIHSNQWTVLSVGDDVIERVHELAKNEGKPKVTSNFKVRMEVRR